MDNQIEKVKLKKLIRYWIVTVEWTYFDTYRTFVLRPSVEFDKRGIVVTTATAQKKLLHVIFATKKTQQGWLPTEQSVNPWIGRNPESWRRSRGSNMMSGQFCPHCLSEIRGLLLEEQCFPKTIVNLEGTVRYAKKVANHAVTRSCWSSQDLWRKIMLIVHCSLFAHTHYCQIYSSR